MEKLSNINENFSEWYQDIISQAELADHSPTKGCMVIRPYGYAMWENIQKVLDKKFKELGVENAYFPMLIPESFFKKEAKHVEGFSPELAVVTHAGGKELEEPLVVRPTSETMIYYMFSKWIKSWRDLPLKLNQWANVVRWEMRTRPFLRTAEFLWQEGHTAHVTFQEALQMSTTMLNVYKTFVEEYLAIPSIAGQKSANERFAGADRTYTFEGIMPDGKALQMGTSHVLSQSFSKAFDIFYQGADGTVQSPFCTSWGVTTRLIGALIMVHGDQEGLIIPPRIAPIQAVIIPIYKTDAEKSFVLEKAEHIKAELAFKNISVKIDSDETKTPGAKFYHWEMRGIPLRIEIGPKDIEKNQAVFVNRVKKDKASKKSFVEINKIGQAAADILHDIQNELLEKAKAKLESLHRSGEKLSDFGPVLENANGFYQTGWCGDAACEALLKNYKATLRCLIEEKKHKNCFNCNKPSISDVIVAKAY